MRKFTLCLLILTSLAAWAKNDRRISVDMNEFDARIRNDVKMEEFKLECTNSIYEMAKNDDSALRPAKLERLANILCSNFVFFNLFMTGKYQEWPVQRPVVGMPLMISLLGATHKDLEDVSAILEKLFLPLPPRTGTTDFTLDWLATYDLTEGTVNLNRKERPAQPAPLEASRRHMFSINIDDWIANREKAHAGELFEWFRHLVNHKESLPLIVATAQHPVEYYQKTGHGEAAQFLSYFRHIYFFDHYTPKAGTCRDILNRS